MPTRLTSSLLLAAALTPGLLAAAEPRVPTFRAVDIDTHIGIGYGVTVADVDGDGKPDIILADKDVIAWYANPTWTKHVIAEKLTEKDHVCVAAADIDGDGKAEIAVGANWNPGDTVGSGSVHYLIAPADRTKKWEVVTLPHEPTVHRMRWVKTASGKYDLVVVPLHGRGNKDGQGAGVRIQAYRMPADPHQPWKTILIDESLHMTHNFEPARGGFGPANPLLVGSKEGVYVMHYVGEELPPRYRIVVPEANGVGELRLGRLGVDRSFLATVEPMHGNALCLYTPPPARPGAKKDEPWVRQVLDETLVDGHALACGDLAGTGSDQIVVGWRAMNRPAGTKVGIKLFSPLNAAGTQWKQTLVDDNTMACEDLCLADLNGDGKLDIIAAGRATKNLKVYFNEGVK